jgi:hypothetical protein
MSLTRLLSWFGRKGGPFLVPVENWSAIVRGGGQGRPPGRRVSRLALEGREHGRTLAAIETNGLRVRVHRLCPLLLWLLVLEAIITSPALAKPPSDAPETPIIAASVTEASLRFGIDEGWIYAVMRQESGGDPQAVSKKGAMGLLQLMPGTWRALSAELGLGADPFEPRANILAGAAYLRRMYDRFGAPGFLAAYNAGPERYARHLSGRQELPAETRAYVQQVNRSLLASAVPRAPKPDWRQAPLFVAAGKPGSLGVDP